MAPQATFQPLQLRNLTDQIFFERAFRIELLTIFAVESVKLFLIFPWQNHVRRIEPRFQGVFFSAGLFLFFVGTGTVATGTVGT